MTSFNWMKALKFAAIAALSAVLLAAAALGGLASIAYLAWNSGKAAPLADLSGGTLAKTFKTRSPALQAKLQDLAQRRLLPNQYPPPGFEAASKRLWDSYSELLAEEPFEKMIESLDAFDEFRAGEPRYADWPSSATDSEQLESFLRFLKFTMQERKMLDAFKADEPFRKAEDFADAASKIAIPCRKPSDSEAELADLAAIMKTRLYIALAEGRRPFALHMLDCLFKIARSPLAPGIDGEALRDDAAVCATAMLKTNGWSERELRSIAKIVEREASAPFMAERIAAAERATTLQAFEKERENAKAGDIASILSGYPAYYEESGLACPLSMAKDLIDALSRDIDKEELLELELIDALQRKGQLAETDRESFARSLSRQEPLSSCEERLLEDYSLYRSHGDATLMALSSALRESLGEPPRKAQANPFSAGASFKARKTEKGFEADIAADGEEKAFAPFLPPKS